MCGISIKVPEINKNSDNENDDEFEIEECPENKVAFNFLLLKLISQYLDRKTLLRLRSVCKHWYTMLTIITDNDDPANCKVFKCPKDIQNYLKQNSESECFPNFNSFHFDMGLKSRWGWPRFINESCPKNKIEITNILHEYSDLFKHLFDITVLQNLTLDLNLFTCFQFLLITGLNKFENLASLSINLGYNRIRFNEHLQQSRSFFKSYPIFPKLKKVKIQVLPLGTEDRRGDRFLKWILEKSPNIEEIELDIPHLANCENWINVLNNEKFKLDKMRSFALNNVNLKPGHEASLLRFLHKAKLESLKISGWNRQFKPFRTEDWGILRQFLKNLSLQTVPLVEFYPFERFHNVTQVSLSFCLIYSLFMKSFLRLFPNLKTLEIAKFALGNLGSEEAAEAENENENLAILRHFNTLKINSIYTVFFLLNNYLSMKPPVIFTENLTNLEINLNNFKLFRFIIKNCFNLESINFINSEHFYSDSILTDVDICGDFSQDYDIQSLLILPFEELEKINILNVFETNERSYQGIRKLKNLHTFKTNIKLFSNNHLTDLAIFFGFKFNKKLKNLDLAYSKITDKSLKLLKQEFNLVSVNICNCLNLSREEIEDYCNTNYQICVYK